MKLLIERLCDTENRSLLENFKNNSNSLKTNNIKALNVWQSQLRVLEKVDLQNLDVSDLNLISQKLTNSLYLMLLQTL